MATRITIPKALEARLRRMAEDPAIPGDFSATTARQLLSRLEDVRSAKLLSEGLSPQEAINVVRKVMGPSAVPPVKFTPAFYAMVSRKIGLLGLTSNDVETAALRARNTLRLPTSLYYVFTIMDRLVQPDRDPISSGMVLGEVADEVMPEVRTGRDE